MTDAARQVVRSMLKASLHAVPTEPLAEQPHPVLDLLERLSGIAAEAIERSAEWTDLQPFQRARLKHLGVAIGATAEDIRKGLNNAF